MLLGWLGVWTAAAGRTPPLSALLALNLHVTGAGALKISLSMGGIFPVQVDRGHKLVSRWFESVKISSPTTINAAKNIFFVPEVSEVCKQEHRKPSHWIQFSAIHSNMQWVQTRDYE